MATRSDCVDAVVFAQTSVNGLYVFGQLVAGEKQMDPALSQCNCNTLPSAYKASLAIRPETF